MSTPFNEGDLGRAKRAQGPTPASDVDVQSQPHPEAVVVVADTFEIPDTIVLARATAEAEAGSSSGSDRRRLAINAAAGGAANAVKILIQLVMLPLMAHLLGPAEFGLYALALPTVAFFTALADGGLGASLAREETGSGVVWSTAFWLLLGIGVCLAAVVSGWGIILAILAHEPRLQGLMGFLSLSFVLITASVLPSARLTRQGRLVIFAVADLSSAVVGAGVAIALAAWGAGAGSLAAQYVVGFFTRAAILNAVAFVRPDFVFQLSSLRPHLSTGSSLLGGRMCDFLGRLLENLVYGRVFGAASLGTYTFANQAPRFICEAASGPIWGAIYAHALREDPVRVAALHRRLVYLLSAVVFPAAFLLSATAPEILNLILGPKWDSASTLLRILIPFYALHVVAAQSGAVLLANGRGWPLFWITFLLTFGRVVAVCTGPWIGPVGVAWAIGGVETVYAVLLFGAPAWTTTSSPVPLLRGLVAPISSSALAGAACYGLMHSHSAKPEWIALALACGLCAYGTAMLLMKGQSLVRDVTRLRRLAIRGGAG